VLLPALRNHPLRTKDPDEASLFFIGYAPLLASRSYPCEGLDPMPAWEKKVADALRGMSHFKRRGGQDFIHLFMKYGQNVNPPLKELYEAGPLVATTDRSFWSISHNLPTPFKKGQVVMMPYVSSTYVDIDVDLGREMDEKSWYFFRGTLFRRFGSRTELVELGKQVTGSNFEGHKMPSKGPQEDVLQNTSRLMRRSSVCPCPQGDAPTSGRLFEALATGCLAIVMSPRDIMANDLPFPSLIDYDEIALFSQSLDFLGTRTKGVSRLAKQMETAVGPKADKRYKKRTGGMRKRALEVFKDHLSYFRNPGGVATSMLFEAWILLQAKGVIEGPYGVEHF